MSDDITVRVKVTIPTSEAVRVLTEYARSTLDQTLLAGREVVCKTTYNIVGDMEFDVCKQPANVTVKEAK